MTEREARPNLRVAVVGGGTGPEYDVSVASADAVGSALERRRHRVDRLTLHPDGSWAASGGDAVPRVGDLAAAVRLMRQADIVFPVIHGSPGEDGAMAGLLEVHGIPYVGSRVAAHAVGYDKAMAKAIASGAGIATAPGVLARDETTEPPFTGPLVVKPVTAGSSYGLGVATSPGELQEAIAAALRFDDRVLIEPFVRGREIDVAIIETSSGELFCGAPLEIGRRDGAVFDTETKYDGTADFTVPCRLEPELQERMLASARHLFRTFGCRDLARIDFFVTADGAIVFNEINTMPGLGAWSQFPRMFAAAGVDYDELIDGLTRTALVRTDTAQRHGRSPGRQEVASATRFG